MVGKDSISIHAGVYGYGFARGLGVRRALNEGVTNEDVGIFDLGVKTMGGVQETHGLASGDEAVANGCVLAEVLPNELGLDLFDVDS